MAFSFLKKNGDDLGTANSVILVNDMIVVDEHHCCNRPEYRQPIAYGQKAGYSGRLMQTLNHLAS